MTYALKIEGVWTEVQGQFVHEGVQYPANWLSLSTDEDRAALGIAEIAEAEPPAFFASSAIEDRDGLPSRIYDEGNNEQRLGHAMDLITKRAEQAFAEGYAPAHPDFAGTRLQVRGVDDRTNWLTSQASYSAAVAQGGGDIVGASFRTMENRTVTISYADGLNVLLGMAAWGAAIMANGWALKDAATAGTPYDIEAGWP